MSPRDGNASGTGSLMMIGGAEDRTDDKVLRSFIALAGGRDAQLVILTSTSEIPDKVWEMYREALCDLGATALSHVRIDSRQAAENEALARQLQAAGGVFITGGDQERLLSRIGGSRAAAAICSAYAGHGACVAGTSAGASGLCTHMIAEGHADFAPEIDGTRMADGLGLVSRVVVDQHFSQRHRINRLLGIVAQNPSLLGAGIDSRRGPPLAERLPPLAPRREPVHARHAGPAHRFHPSSAGPQGRPVNIALWTAKRPAVTAAARYQPGS